MISEYPSPHSTSLSPATIRARTTNSRSRSGPAATFIRNVRAFYKFTTGVVPRTTLNIERMCVDIRRLHECVQARGGYDAVSDSRAWPSVLSEVGHPSLSAAGAAVLRKFYEDVLAPYVDFISRGLEIPAEFCREAAAELATECASPVV
jgi:hypothetical protein